MKSGLRSLGRRHVARSKWLAPIVSAAALQVLILTVGMAHAFTNSSLSGSYACKLDGSFIRQPFSIVTISFTADGKGNIDGLGSATTALETKSGSMSALMAAFGTGQAPSPGSPALYFGEMVTDSCGFLVHDGTYQIFPEGRGTMTIHWTAHTTNSTAPVDCSGDISAANYELLLSSTSSLYLAETDTATANCTGSGIIYNNCGAIMSGTCTKQTGVTFPKAVPTP